MSFSETEIRKHDRLLLGAYSLIRSEVLIEGEERSVRPSMIARWRLRRGIKKLEKAIRINPSWQNHYWMGKALQRLGHFRKP